MSQIFFSKQDPTEKLSRLSLLGSSKGTVVLWLKGKKNRREFKVDKFDKERMEIVLEGKEIAFGIGDKILCSFELRGMNFFSEVTFQVSVGGYAVLHFNNTLFKSERRTSYRLLTFPIYEIYAEFNVGKIYEDGKVVQLNSKSNQTGIFKSFLNLVEPENQEARENSSILKIRIQDLSTTGMAIHVSELEAAYFKKGFSYNNVALRFSDQVIIVPELSVVYLVDYISSNKNLKQYKVGIHFNNLPVNIDEALGKKINELLRENDFNKDFENFIK